jgi:hypothetical protein
VAEAHRVAPLPRSSRADGRRIRARDGRRERARRRADPGAHGWKVVSPARGVERSLAVPRLHPRLARRVHGREGAEHPAPSGWFSDRAACYLAAGRPVVLQDTGFGDVLRSAPACTSSAR